MRYKIMSYNIEQMKDLFKKNSFNNKKTDKTVAVTDTIKAVSPDILGIVEASNKLVHHQKFNENYLKDLNYKIVKSEVKRSRQDLVFYYREPFELVSFDENVNFYDDWIEDIDEDTIDEVLRFERKPLEVLFRINGKEIMIILIAFKSKGVFIIANFHKYQSVALANRKKLYGQAKKVRERLDNLMRENPERAIIVMGDLNDEIGMDHFQKIVGASSVETITGNIMEPEKIMHNALWHLKADDHNNDVWTTEYEDMIVANRKKHRAWLDHIFISPGMMKESSEIKYIKDSGQIGEKNETGFLASDHFPIFCEIEVNE